MSDVLQFCSSDEIMHHVVEVATYSSTKISDMLALENFWSHSNEFVQLVLCLF